jgi:hypothetical protein
MKWSEIRALILPASTKITARAKLKVILEVATLDVKPGQEGAFEVAFTRAQQIISGMRGYLSH